MRLPNARPSVHLLPHLHVHLLILRACSGQYFLP